MMTSQNSSTWLGPAVAQALSEADRETERKQPDKKKRGREREGERDVQKHTHTQEREREREKSEPMTYRPQKDIEKYPRMHIHRHVCIQTYTHTYVFFLCLFVCSFVCLFMCPFAIDDEKKLGKTARENRAISAALSQTGIGIEEGERGERGERKERGNDIKGRRISTGTWVDRYYARQVDKQKDESRARSPETLKRPPLCSHRLHAPAVFTRPGHLDCTCGNSSLCCSVFVASCALSPQVFFRVRKRRLDINYLYLSAQFHFGLYTILTQQPVQTQESNALPLWALYYPYTERPTQRELHWKLQSDWNLAAAAP